MAKLWDVRDEEWKREKETKKKIDVKGGKRDENGRQTRTIERGTVGESEIEK